MISSTHIHALTARYIVPRGDPRAAPRLDRLLRRVLDEALEPALARAGLPVDATVCVRSLTSHTTLELATSDDALVLAWSLHLSRAIAATVERGAADVVVFASPHHALTALATDIAAADLTRAWAYGQLGFGDLTRLAAPGRADLLVRALARTPAAIVPLLTAFAQRGRLASLVAAWTPHHWHTLAHVAASRHGLDPAPLLNATPSPSQPVPRDISSRPPAPTPANSQPSAADEHADPRADVPDHAATSAAPEPSLSRTTALPDLDHPVTLTDLDPSSFDQPTLNDLDHPLARALRELRLPPTTHRAAALLAALATLTTSSTRITSQVDTLVRRLALDTLVTRQPATRTRLVADPRPTGTSELGGLLFLVHILAALDLSAELSVDATFTARSPRWIFHRLALALITAASGDTTTARESSDARSDATAGEADPAILAFAGLPPDAASPSRDQPPPTADETARLTILVERITAALRLRLRAPASSTARLLAQVCRRRARIVADPGWFAVHLSLRSVDTDLRRAGLDLDPDFVPWLGVVLKFIYA